MIFFVKLLHFEGFEEKYSMIHYIGVKQYNKIASAIAKLKRKNHKWTFFKLTMPLCASGLRNMTNKCTKKTLLFKGYSVE